MADEEAGCPTCRGHWDQGIWRQGPVDAKEKLSVEMARRVFAGVSWDPERYSRAMYENAHITRCRECRTMWLEQYWELERVGADVWNEWGDRYWALTPMEEDDLAVIEEAQSSGRLLPHDRFFRQGAGSIMATTSSD